MPAMVAVAGQTSHDYPTVYIRAWLKAPLLGGVSEGRGGFFCFRMLMISQDYAMALREGQSEKPRRTATI